MKSIFVTASVSLALAIGLTTVSFLPEASAADAPTGQVGNQCAQLATLRLPDVEITSATSLAAGANVANSGLLPMFGDAPVVGAAPAALCRVVGSIKPTAASDIGFEVWLPASGWNGRLHGIGIGGFAGVIDYHALSGAVSSGQVGVATNTGHSGTMTDYSWAIGQPERVRDYAWRAVHLSTVAAKALTEAFYGRRPDRSYFVGCSGGGRQGLVQAARFPDDYDGVLAGAPAANFTDLAMAFTNSVQAQNAPGAAIRPEQAGLLQEEVLRQCDGIDGQVDGLVADPRQCGFDAAPLACGTSNSPQCFSTPQIAALNRIHAGPRNAAGRQLARGYLPSGSEAGAPVAMLGWEGYLLRGDTGVPGGEGLANGMLGALIQSPFATPATFDWNRHPERLRRASREIDAPLNLRRFFARGGKLIMWHGWADAAIPPEATLDYHAAMLRRSGRQAGDNVRLFMVPGVQHCAGGVGPDSFGQVGAPQAGDTPERSMVAALQAWTEGSRAAPESFVARRGHGDMMRMMGQAPSGPERQRLLCAWPKREILTQGADPDKAESYTCV